MKKIVFAILFLFLFVNTTFALEECTPSEEYKKYMALSEEEKKEYVEPAYCEELMNEESNDSFLVSFFKTVTNTISASSMASSYNAVNDGLISTPENQGSLGTCWSFSALSAVEANARKNNIGNYNLSEKHAIYSLLSSAYSDSQGKKGKYKSTNFNGGKATYIASYFFNNIGQLPESEWRYTDSFTQISSSEYKKGRNILNVGGFDLANVGNYGACSASDLTYIKGQIANYGSVQVSMYMDEALFKDSSNNYYISSLSNSDLPNHGVSIVGWDDNISRTRFNASRDGAFIIKNSWGPTWSDDGYFYVSYDDPFICKNIATYYDVSNKEFENTYKAADMIGVPTLRFNGTYYISAKFKNAEEAQALLRVSFPIGPKSDYTVYLSKDNNLDSQNNWIELTSGSSDVYGIKSYDIQGDIVSSSGIDRDYFTIIVKYVVNSGQDSSIFTMCSNIDDTSNMEYSSGTNFISIGSGWIDMHDIPTQNGTISCEPNIFAYSELAVADLFEDGNIAINSIVPYSTLVSNNKFTVSITNNNVSTNSISYMITNSNNTNVTSHFTITPNYNTNKIVVTSDGTVSGRFNFIIKYGTSDVRTTFNINSGVTSTNSSFVSISGTNMTVNITNNYELTKKKLLNSLNTYNTTVQVLNKNGNVVTDDNAKIGTNAKVVLNNNTYKVIVLGDVNGDGKISALDYIEIRKHIMGTIITDSGMLSASDLDKNNTINALDYIAVRMILMR